ncbi:MAG: alanine racemase, partial [Peptococcales bacterium]
MYKWIEVNLDAIKNNYVKVRENIDPKTKILAVVKADAYGHGLIEVSKELVRQGVDYLGVTEIAEGIKLREAGLSVPILVFGSFLSEDAFYFQEFKLTATLADLETIKKVIVQNLKFTFHLKVETGLGRTGLKYDQLAKFVEIIRDNNDIIFEGVYSHLATSMWSDNSFSKKQFSEFTKAIDFLKSHGFNPPLKHICNSAAFVKFP